jgi:hypothetical protein
VRGPYSAARWRRWVDVLKVKRKRQRRSKVELAVEALCGRVIDTQKISRLLKALSPNQRKLVRKQVAERNAELEGRILSRYYPFGLKS